MSPARDEKRAEREEAQAPSGLDDVISGASSMRATAVLHGTTRMLVTRSPERLPLRASGTFDHSVNAVDVLNVDAYSTGTLATRSWYSKAHSS